MLDGNSVEQLIDGNICSIGNPSYFIKSFIEEEAGTFLILFDQGKLKRYAYDPNISSVPENCLKIYGLKENVTLKQAISQFQINDPSVYIEYEIGMGSSSDITYEDAIQNLNKKLLSDDCPDIILLDDLPMDTYVKDGVLADLSEYKANFNPDNAILTNITEGFATEKGLFVVPVRYSLPVLVTYKDKINQIKNNATLADMVEEMYEKNPEKKVMGLYTPEEVLELTLMIEASNFDKDDQFEKEKCKEMLTQAKRIYNVMLQTMTPQEIEEHINNMEYSFAHGISNKWFFQASGQAVDVLAGSKSIAAGLSFGLSFDMNTIFTVPRSDDTYTYRLGFYEGDTHYVPSCMLGVTANSTHKDIAANFIATALSLDVQDVDMSDGLPVNTKSLQKNYDMGLDETAISGSLGISQEGSMEPFMLEIKYPNKEQSTQMDAYLKSLDTPFVMDETMKDTILEIGSSALTGGISIDEAEEIDAKCVFVLQNRILSAILLSRVIKKDFNDFYHEKRRRE